MRENNPDSTDSKQQRSFIKGKRKNDMKLNESNKFGICDKIKQCSKDVCHNFQARLTDIAFF